MGHAGFPLAARSLGQDNQAESEKRQVKCCGTVFKITQAGPLTTLYSFNGTDGGNPTGGLAQDTNGTFYETTNEGGSDNNCAGGCRTVFSLLAGLGPFVGNTAHFWQGGSDGDYLGKRSDRHDQRHL